MLRALAWMSRVRRWVDEVAALVRLGRPERRGDARRGRRARRLPAVAVASVVLISWLLVAWLLVARLLVARLLGQGSLA